MFRINLWLKKDKFYSKVYLKFIYRFVNLKRYIILILNPTFLWRKSLFSDYYALLLLKILAHRSRSIIFHSPINNVHHLAVKPKMEKLLLMKIGDGSIMSEDIKIVLQEFNGIKISVLMGQHAQKIAQLMVFPNKIGATPMEPVW